jgi:bifunctional enzyme CysN/CysC
MVTGASRADIVLVLADAARGLTQQTRRHLSVAALLKAPRIVVAVNKMDLVRYDRATFEHIKADLTQLATALGVSELITVPISALKGDFVVSRSETMPWYEGKSILEVLDEVQEEASDTVPVRLPVQLVLRGPQTTRFYAGTLLGGTVQVGDELRTNSASSAKVRSIVSGGTEVAVADPGHPIAVQLDREIDVTRGDWLMPADQPSVNSDVLEATLFWLQPDILRLGMTYQMRQGPRVIPARVVSLGGNLDFSTGHFVPGDSLAMNEVGLVRIELARAVPLETYGFDRNLGSFILVDAHNQTVAAGRVDKILSPHSKVSAPGEALAALGKVVWLTGLSGAGKSTLAQGMTERLHARGRLAIHLDADKLRTGINRDLGFTTEDRLENVRRTAEVAKLFADQGFITFCSVISPLRQHRDLAREVVGTRFVEVHVNCGLDECVRRDTKGLYAKALAGTIKEFTGISAPYESPEAPELVIDTESQELDACLEQLEKALQIG